MYAYNGFVSVLRICRQTLDFHLSFLVPESSIFSCRTEEVPIVQEALSFNASAERMKIHTGLFLAIFTI